MAQPIRVPEQQMTAFEAALVERFNLDPSQITDAGFSWEITGGDEDARITWTGVALMPAQELLDLFNGSGHP